MEEIALNAVEDSTKSLSQVMSKSSDDQLLAVRLTLKRLPLSAKALLELAPLLVISLLFCEVEQH